jgi:hypothetical protein
MGEGVANATAGGVRDSRHSFGGSTGAVMAPPPIHRIRGTFPHKGGREACQLAEKAVIPSTHA